MPAASSSAALRAAGEYGTGSVKLICTSPSPRWSAYGRTAVRSPSLGDIALLAHQLHHRVEVQLARAHDPLDAAPVVQAAADIAERRPLDRREQPRVGDPLEDLMRSREHFPGARLDDAPALELDLLAEVPRGVEHVGDVL